MGTLRTRFGQSIAIASAALVLTTFPLHKPLAEEIPKKPVAAEQQAKKQEQGTLKLSTNSCKTGESIFVDVVNSKGEQIRGETVKVISPTGKEYEVLISNELNGFVFENTGHYKFVYNNQTQVVCVKPSRDSSDIRTITPQELDKISSGLFYIPLSESNINIIELDISAVFIFCYFQDSCARILSRHLSDVSSDDIERAIAGKSTIFLIQHGRSLLVIDLRSINELVEELKVHGLGDDENTRVKVKEYDGKDISFLLFPLNNGRKPLDGGLAVEIKFNLKSNTGSIVGHSFIHDDSECPLKTPTANSVQ